MSKKKSERIDLGGPAAAAADSGSAGSGLTHNPFASLRGSLGDAPEAAESRGWPTEASPVPSPSEPKALGGTVVVCHERKGHGGKTVTVADLSRAEGPPCDDLDELAKSLRKALGAGARAGDQCVTVQGDQVERVAAFFEESFGANVTLGTR